MAQLDKLTERDKGVLLQDLYNLRKTRGQCLKDFESLWDDSKAKKEGKDLALEWFIMGYELAQSRHDLQKLTA